MSKGSNQKLKLSYLQQILLRETDDNHGITMKQIRELLESYDVTSERKSIYADIAALEDLGIEVESFQEGRDTFYHVVGRQFELAELKLLVDAIQSSKFITENKSNELIKKIESLASKYEAQKLQRQVYVSGRVKTMNGSVLYSIDTLHAAIADNKQITFLYCEYNTKKELVPRSDGKVYKISPWGLSWDDENYYMIGFDPEPKAGQSHIKHYRVDKMKSIALTEDVRQGKEYFEGFDIASYARMNFGMYGGDRRLVKIRFANRFVGIFIDRFGKDISIVPEKDEGYSHINVEVAVSSQFFGWIFSLGTEVQIVGPDDVRGQMKEYIDLISNNY